MAYLNGKKVNNAKYVNEDVINAYLSAGIDPATGKPARTIKGSTLKGDIFKLLQINDEQAAINTFKWYNLPKGVDSNLIERILYYRGQGAFFYKNEEFFFLPFVMGSKGIDCYGRFKNITPLPFNGAISSEKDKPWINGVEFDVLYDIFEEEFFDDEKCVLISDFSKQISQTNIARKILNTPIINLEADMLPYARTNLLNGTGVSGMRVTSEDESSNVEAASQSINSAALNGKKYVPVVGQTDFQDLTGSNLSNVEQYLMTMQSIDNFRLQTHGVDSGGIFQKQAHLLESENALNTEKSSYVLQDRLSQRQRACDLINSLFGLGIWCDISEQALGVDIDEDGETYENNPEETEEEGGFENVNE